MLVDSFTAFNVPPRVFLWGVIGLAVIAMVKNLVRPVSLYEAARTIDRGASLKDRVISCLEQIEQKTDEPLTDLQLQDTSQKVQKGSL